jgi:enoyl-CoA hydratase/3-hydroxyacyl-CoA dehydrogenase
MLRRAEKLTAAHAYELGVVAALADDHQALIALAIEEVKALGERPRAIAGGAAAIPTLERVEPFAANGMALSPTVIGLMENAIREAARAPTLAAALEVGYRAFGQSACTAAAREGIAAFAEHRQPNFVQTG